MTQPVEVSSSSEPVGRREAWRQLAHRFSGAGLFALGVVAALIAVALYSVLAPRPQPLTTKQVSTVVAAAMASATPPPAYSATVYRIIQPSLVLIQTGGLHQHQGSGGNIAEPSGLGSGVVISDKGEILTALHVVDGASEIDVTFADGTESKAKVVGTQPQNDIAVLQPDQTPEVVVPAVMGNPGAVREGDEAYAFGNPFGLYGSLSAGTVTGLHRSFESKTSGRTIQDLIQIDAAVNPGNSGGPLLNRNGQVVGIVVALLNPTDQDFFVGIGFAVPITTAAGAAGAPAY